MRAITLRVFEIVCSSGSSSTQQIKPMGKLSHGYNEAGVHSESVAFSADGKTLASAYTRSSHRKGEVVLWDVSTKSRRATIDLGQESRFAISVVFSPDGNLLAAAHLDGVLIMDAKAQEIKHQIRISRLDQNGPIAITPDSKVLSVNLHSTAELPSELVFFDLATAKEKMRIKSDGKAVPREKDGWIPGKTSNYYGPTTFSADGKLMAAVREDKAQIWDMGTMVEKRAIPVRRGHSAAVSPNGKLIAVS